MQRLVMVPSLLAVMAPSQDAGTGSHTDHDVVTSQCVASGPRISFAFGTFLCI